MELHLHLCSPLVNWSKWRRHPERFRKAILCDVTLALSIAGSMCALAFAQNPAPAQDRAHSPLDAARIIPFLDETLTWYRQMALCQQIANDPSEVTLVSENRQIADQIVRLSFDFARAEADALAGSHGSSPFQAHNGGTPQQQSLLKTEQAADEEVKKTESELNSLKQKLATATARQRELLQSQIVDVQGELDLAKTRKDAIHNMVEFVAGAGGGQAGGLRGQIDALAASVPTIAAAGSAGGNPVNAKDQSNASTEATASEPTGIGGLGAELFEISRKLNSRIRLYSRAQAERPSGTYTFGPWSSAPISLRTEAGAG